MSDIKNEITLEEIKEALKITEETGFFPYPGARKDKLISYFRYLITTNESQQRKIDLFIELLGGNSEVMQTQLTELDKKDALIESQKEKLDLLTEPPSEIVDFLMEGITQKDLLIESLQKKVESLKAITELAVKGLQEVIIDSNEGSYSILTIATDTLSEIERLQNGS